MTKRNLKLLGLWLALALLCAGLFATATADEAPAILRIANAEVNDGIASGNYYYKVYFDTGDVDTLQIGWGEDASAEEPLDSNVMELSLEDLDHDEGGAFLISWFGNLDETEEETAEDSLFARLNEADPWQKVGFVYALKAEDDTRTVQIDTDEAPALLEPFWLRWSACEGADEYLITWRTPSGRTYRYMESGTECEITQDNYGGPENVLSGYGAYEVEVTPFVDNVRGATATATFAVEVPEADERVFFNTNIEEDEDHNRFVPLHGDFEYDVSAPNADYNRVEVYFGNGETEENWVDDDPDHGDNYGRCWGVHSYHEESLPEFDRGEPHCYTAYARAMFDGEWVYSNTCDFQVYVDSALEGSVSYRVLNDTVARDGLVQVEVDPLEGAEFCEAFIDSNDGWIALSHWVDVNPEGTTLVTMPVSACEPGEYQLNVYVGKPGAKYLYSEQETTITVNPPRLNSDIMFSMKDEYESNEPLRLAAYYNNTEGLDNVWMEVRVSPKDDPEEEIYRESMGPDFRDDWFGISEPGEYVIEACVYQDVEDDEPEQISAAQREISVVAPNGPLDIDYEIELPSILPVTGDEELYTIHVPYPGAPVEWMNVRLSDRDDNTWFEDWDLSEGVDMSFHTWEGQNVTVEVWGFARGYETMYYRSPRIPVGELNEAIHLTVDDEGLLDEAGVANVLLNQDVNMTVSADEGEIRTVRFFGGYDFWDDREPDRDGTYHANPSFGDEGMHTVYAMVTFDDVEDGYDWDQGDPRTWYVSNSVQINVAEPVGEVPPFEIALERESAARGENVRVVFTRDAVPEVEVEYSVNLWHDFEEDEERFDYDWHWQWEDDWTDTGDGRQQRTAIIVTAGLPENVYRVSGEGRYIGYAQYHTDWDGRPAEELTITEANLPENGILFTVNKTELETSEDYGLSVYAPGADWIDIFFDFDNGEDWWDNWGGDSVSDSRSYGSSGVYTLVARAWYPEWDEAGEPLMDIDENGESYHVHTPVDSDPVQVTVTAGNGALSAPVVELSDTLTINDEGDQIDDLWFKLYRPENAENYNIRFEVEGWGGDDAFLMEMNDDEEQVDDDGNAFIEGVLPGSLLVERGVRQMDVIKANVYASARGYEDKGLDRRIPVVPAAGDNVSIALTDESLMDEEGVINIPASSGFEVCVSSDGTEIKSVRLFDGDDLRGEEGPDDWEDPTYYKRDVYFGRGGQYSVYAMVTFDEVAEDYDWDQGDPRTWIATNKLTVCVEQLGVVGPFTISADRDEVTCGEPVEVTFTAAENGEDYGINLWDDIDEDNDDYRRYDYDWAWKGDWFEEDGQQKRVAILSTGGLPAGEYTYDTWSNGQGYEGSSSNQLRLTVHDPEDMPEVLFVVDRDQVRTNENFTFSIRADGAHRVEIDRNYPRGEWDGRERSQFSKPLSRGEAGTYKLMARAWYFDYDENDELIEETNEAGETWYREHCVDSEVISVVVTADAGALEFNGIDGLPATLQLRDGAIIDDLAFNVPLPENAENMDVHLHVDGRDDDFYNEDGNGDIAPEISAERLSELNMQPGDTITVDVNAYATGYEAVHWNQRITVVEAAGEGAELIVGEGDIDNLFIGDEIKFLVRPDEGNALTAVRFFNGHGYWEDGGEINHDNHDDWFEGDESAFFWERYDEPRELTVYAEVRLNDSEEWITTNNINFAVRSNGLPGPFDFTNLDDIYVARGNEVQFNFSESENADNYWVDAFDMDNNSYNPQTSCDGTTVTMQTINLPEGEYYVYGRSDADKWDMRESSSSVRLIVTEYEGNDIQLSVSKDEVLTNEQLHISVYAPGAVRVGIACDGSRWDLDEEGNPVWGDEEGNPFDLWEDWHGFNNPGTYTFVGYAQYEGSEDWIEGNTVKVTATSNGQKLDLDLSEAPVSVTEGQSFGFNVPWPDNENACYLDYEWHLEGEEGSRFNSWNQPGNDLWIDIDGSDLRVGDIVHIGIWTSAVGYDHHHYNLNIPVLEAPSQEVTLALEERDRYVSNTGYNVTVTAQGADAVKLYNGDDFLFDWENDTDEWTLDENGECVLVIGYGDPGKRALYAMARFGEEWKTSEAISVDIQSSGPAPVAEVEVPEYVWSGSDALIRVADPGEGWYHVSVSPRNGENIFDYQYGDDGTSGAMELTIPAENLAEGVTYDVTVSFAADGCDQTEVRGTFEVVVPSVKLATDKRVYYYGDEITFNVDAPLAESVKIYNGEAELEGNTWVADLVSDEVIFTAKATFEGMDAPLESNPIAIQVRSLGTAPEPALYYANSYSEGDNVEISVGTDGDQAQFYQLTVTRDEETVLSESGVDAGTYSIPNIVAGEYGVVLDFGRAGYDDGVSKGGFTVVHNYVDPAFEWDGESCTVKITCRTCDFLETLEPEITGKVVHEPTCTEEGTKTLTATVEFRGETYAQEHNVPIEPNGHAPEDVERLEPTCTEDGHEGGTQCSVCGETISGMEIIEKLGHEAGEWSVARNGRGSYIHGRCIRCGEEQVPDQEINVDVIGDDPTCTEGGEYTYTFSGTEKYRWEEVKDTWTEHVDALGHDWGEWETTEEPTCERYGKQTRECSRCHESRTKTIAKLPHTEVIDEAVEATCTETGLTEGRHCSVCNTVIVAQEEIPALDHDLEHHEAQAATCTEIGWEAYDTCSRCDYTTYVEIAALDHDLEHHEARAATCTEIGWEAYDACKREGCDYTTYVEIPALGHTLTAHAQVDATYTATGIEAYWECTVCHKLYSDEACTTEIERPVTIPVLTPSQEDQAAADAVIAKIDALPAEAGLDNKAAVEEAKAAYDALTDDQKALVSADALTKLTTAESQVTAAEAAKAEADQAAADAAIAKINALPAEAGLESKAAVEEARAAYDALTEDQKALVSQELKNKLTKAETDLKAAEDKAAADQKAAEEKVKADKAAADAAAAKINKLPATIATTDKAAVEAAKAAYDALTADQKALVDSATQNKLTKAETDLKAAEDKAAADQKAAEEKAKADKAAADAAAAKINALNATITTADKTAVEAAKAAYDALTEDQKKLVDSATQSKLTKAEADLKAAEDKAAEEQKAAEEKAKADKAAADAAIAKINALNATITTADKTAVEAAKAAYDALTDDQKKLVDSATQSKLTKAETDLKAAEDKAAAEQKAAEEKAAADQAAAKTAADAINALPASAGTADKGNVAAARAAYDALTDDQKALVNADTLNKLTAAESQVTAAEAAEAEEAARKAAEEAAAAQKAAADQAAAQAVADAINALPASAGVADKDAVAAARAAYDALTEEQKALIGADVAGKLTAAESQVAAASEPAPLPPTYEDETGKYTINAAELTATYTAPAKKVSKVKSAKIPEEITVQGVTLKVTAIGDKAFYKAKKMTKVTIGANVQTIGKSAFASCVKLKTVSGGSGIVTIGASAFKGDKVLAKITLGKKLTTIGKSAFNGCKKLKTVTIKSSKLKKVGSSAFKGVSSSVTFKCPSKKLKAYKKLIKKAGAPSKAKYKK